MERGGAYFREGWAYFREGLSTFWRGVGWAYFKEGLGIFWREVGHILERGGAYFGGVFKRQILAIQQIVKSWYVPLH